MSEVLSELLESEVPSEEPVESDVLFDVPELSAVELYASPFAEVSEVPVKPSVVVYPEVVPLVFEIWLVRSLIFCSILVFSEPSTGVG